MFFRLWISQSALLVQRGKEQLRPRLQNHYKYKYKFNTNTEIDNLFSKHQSAFENLGGRDGRAEGAAIEGKLLKPGLVFLLI